MSLGLEAFNPRFRASKKVDHRRDGSCLLLGELSRLGGSASSLRSSVAGLPEVGSISFIFNGYSEGAKGVGKGRLDV